MGATNKRAVLTLTLMQMLLLGFTFGLALYSFVPTNRANGVQRIIVLPVYFSNRTSDVSLDLIANRFDALIDYYNEVSYGMIHLSYYLAQWIYLDNPIEFYAINSTFGVEPRNNPTDGLFLDAIASIDAQIDFSQFEHLFVVHSGDDDDIWTSHVYSWFPTNDGRIFNGASIVNVDDEMGTYAHELAHGFGAPDLYDYHSDGLSGIAYWGLMDSGNYNGNPSGTVPAHMCAFTKLKLGLISEDSLYRLDNESVSLELIPISVNLPGFRALRFNLANGLYYLVEARSSVGYDSGIPYHGVLIYQVNESRTIERNAPCRAVIPEMSSNLIDCGLLKGESYADNKTGFYVSVVDWSEDCVRINVSTASEERWHSVDTIIPNPPKGITNDQAVFFTTGHYYENDRIICAAFVDNGTSITIDLFCSDRTGRYWTYLYGTDQCGYSFYRYHFSLAYYGTSIFFGGTLLNHDTLFVEYNLQIPQNPVRFHNLTDLFGLKLDTPRMAAGPDGIYVVSPEYLNGSWGVSYLKYTNNQWFHSRDEGNLANRVEIASSYSDAVPLVLERLSTDILKLRRFNSTTVIHEWNVTAANDFDVVENPNGNVGIFYLDEDSENSTIRVDYASDGSSFHEQFTVTDDYFLFTRLSLRNSTGQLFLLTTTYENSNLYDIAEASRLQLPYGVHVIPDSDITSIRVPLTYRTDRTPITHSYYSTGSSQPLAEIRYTKSVSIFMIYLWNLIGVIMIACIIAVSVCASFILKKWPDLNVKKHFWPVTRSLEIPLHSSLVLGFAIAILFPLALLRVPLLDTLLGLLANLVNELGVLGALVLIAPILILYRTMRYIILGNLEKSIKTYLMVGLISLFALLIIPSIVFIIIPIRLPPAIAYAIGSFLISVLIYGLLLVASMNILFSVNRTYMATHHSRANENQNQGPHVCDL